MAELYGGLGYIPPDSEIDFPVHPVNLERIDVPGQWTELAACRKEEFRDAHQAVFDIEYAKPDAALYENGLKDEEYQEARWWQINEKQRLIAAAKAICEEVCTVQQACDEYAYYRQKTNDPGIYNGQTGKEFADRRKEEGVNLPSTGSIRGRSRKK